MSSLIEEYEHKGFTIEIHYDTDPPECPLENYGPDEARFITFERNTTLRKYHDFKHPSDVVFPKGGMQYNLYKFEHGNVIYATHSFSCPWDSGQVGLLWTNGEIDPEGVCKDVTSWCNGEIYGFVIKDSEDDTVDSCWGFIGDIDYCKTEAEAAIDDA